MAVIQFQEIVIISRNFQSSFQEIYFWVVETLNGSVYKNEVIMYRNVCTWMDVKLQLPVELDLDGILSFLHPENFIS